MISGKTAAVVAVAILAVFAAITVETINHSGSSLSSSSLSTSSSDISVTSPQNASNIMVTSASQQVNITLNITSNSTSVYIYDVSPDNVSAFQHSGTPTVYSISNLTSMDRTLYPYNYMETNVTAGSTTVVNFTLYINSTAFSQMKASSPQAGAIYPYVVEILAETSSGASAVGFTLMKV